jgi:hypothetical protein
VVSLLALTLQGKAVVGPPESEGESAPFACASGLCAEPELVRLLLRRSYKGGSLGLSAESCKGQSRPTLSSSLSIAKGLRM